MNDPRDLDVTEEHTAEDFPKTDEFPDYDRVDSRSVDLPAASYEGEED